MSPAARPEPAGLDVDATSVVFRPVRAGNAFEETVERLLSVVKLGLLGPGDRLPPERELAARLEVSRMTPREAIRALQQAGYVSSRRGCHGGTFVLAPVSDLEAVAAARPGSTDELELSASPSVVAAAAIPFNYAPIAVGVVFVYAGGYWLLSARKWFTGPRAQGDEAALEKIEAEFGHIEQELAAID